MTEPRDRKFAAALRLLCKRVATLEARTGIAPPPNVMHDNRPAPRVEHQNIEAQPLGANRGHGDTE